MGVMIQMLGGNRETVEAFQSSLDKVITGFKLEDNVITFDFEDGSALDLYDAGQSCCESRWITTDDTLEDFIGGKLVDAEVSEIVDADDEDSYEVHEVAFLRLTTTKGVAVFETHVDHNGYYGGFAVVARKRGGN